MRTILFIFLLYPAVLVQAKCPTELYATAVQNYNDWINNFEMDFNSLIEFYQKQKKVTRHDINSIFSDSVFQDSLMVDSLLEMISSKSILPDKKQMFLGDIPTYGKLLPIAISNSKPTGCGGIYPKSGGAVVVYLDISIPVGKNVFEGNSVKDGELVRDTLPFVVLHINNHKIKLWGISREFDVVINAMRKSKMDKARRELFGF